MAEANVVSIKGYVKRLLAHELQLYNDGQLINITHEGSSAIWLEAPSSTVNEGQVNVYRPMGDAEVLFLVEHRQLPSTQPYQAIIEGDNGRVYAQKYLQGKKWTNTHPSTVVEFTIPIQLAQTLKAKQMKIEDGALSIGLGFKAGKGLPLFNQSLRDGQSSFRIVLVKRKKDKLLC